MSVEIKRLNTIKTDVKSLVSGNFVKKEGFESSYVISKTGSKLSRVRIMGTVTDKFSSSDNMYGAVTIDDCTGNIRAKSFKSIAILSTIEKGDIVDIIGRVRLYNEEMYLSPEIIYKVGDPNLILLRKVELLKQKREFNEKRKIILESRKKTSDIEELRQFVKKKYGIEPEELESVLLLEEMPKSAEDKEDSRESEKDAVIKLIERLDTGSGCEYSLLIKESGMDESVIESVINELLSDGLCFEPRPGVIKLL